MTFEGFSDFEEFVEIRARNGDGGRDEEFFLQFGLGEEGLGVDGEEGGTCLPLFLRRNKSVWAKISTLR